jgi:hypothetical protein
MSLARFAILSALALAVVLLAEETFRSLQK